MVMFKNHLPLILCIAFSCSASAQLYVGGDHFIFASDVQLFVSQEVELQDQDSKLYLRDGAQLLQGNTSVGNSGLGELSVQQTGTVNQFAYNYWCSPIGDGAIAAGNESFRVDLIDEPTGLISSVDVGFTTAFNSIASPLQISDRWLYTFVEATTYTEWNYVSSNGAIAPGLGFTMKGIGTAPTGNQVYDFRGKPNNGDITNPVATNAFTLIGNPYPSALDAALFINDPVNSDITGTLYFWEQQPGTTHFIADYIGGYATLTYDSAFVESFARATFSTYDGAGIPVAVPPGPGGTKDAERYQPIGQGFLVRGSNDGNVTVRNEHRAFVQEGPDSFFFRNAEIGTPADEDLFYQVPEDYKRFRINVDFNDLYTRQLLHNFHHTATDGFDRGLEGHRPGGPASDAFWILEEDKFVIQAHSFDESLRIPLIVNAENNQPLRFRILDVQHFDDQPIYLYDNASNIYVDLKSQHYDINIDAGYYPNRFEITFNRGTLSNNEFEISDFKIVQNNTAQELQLFNNKSLDIRSFQLIDVSGKTVLKQASLGNANEFTFGTSKLSEGVYIANITLTNGGSISQKIIITN